MTASCHHEDIYVALGLKPEAAVAEFMRSKQHLSGINSNFTWTVSADYQAENQKMNNVKNLDIQCKYMYLFFFWESEVTFIHIAISRGSGQNATGQSAPGQIADGQTAPVTNRPRTKCPQASVFEASVLDRSDLGRYFLVTKHLFFVTKIAFKCYFNWSTVN